MTHNKKFLIFELQRFVLENGRNPRAIDMQGGFGYPSRSVYISHFGTWNNALLAAGLKINQRHDCWQDGTETCDNCGQLNKINRYWTYYNEQRLCDLCYSNLNNYKNGNLDPESTVGFAFISQRVVAKTLGLDLKHDCNCSIGFNASYDLYNKNYKYINVKSAILYKDNIWHFDFGNKYIPDNYIMLGFSDDKSDILHVWITEPEDDLTFDDKNFKFKSSISITNSYKGLNRVESWEVDVEPYNDTYHSMSLDNCKVLRSD